MLLWWNEGRSADQENALNEMHEVIVTLPDTKYNIAYEDKAVLVQGKVVPINEVFDPDFSVRSDGLKLVKDVKMYQWIEKISSRSEDKMGGETQTVTTYT